MEYTSANFNGILELVDKVKASQIDLYYDQDLVIKHPKNKAIDKNLLKEIRENKIELIEYLQKNNQSCGKCSHCDKCKMTEIDNLFKSGLGNNIVNLNGEQLYEITPRQNWWLDEKKDIIFKKKTFGFFKYKISGNFKVEFFKDAIRHLIDRHESLRASFVKVESRHMMKILPANEEVLDLIYSELKSVSQGLEIPEDEFINFQGHEFDVTKGPLFFVRVLQGDNCYFISLKLHHVIYDAWSVDVLMRDLYLAYYSISNQEKPPLNKLRFQYKDYMGRYNLYREKYYDRDMSYWSSLFRSLPGELIIPFQKNTFNTPNESVRYSEVGRYILSQDLSKQMASFAGKHSASLFIILQATLNFYLVSVTGQTDIVIGTQVFGREMLDDMENQIGFYSRMNLLRTIFNGNDSFEDCLVKIIKVNDDMNVYKAFPLIDYIEKILSAADQMTGSFWKINMQYYDLGNYVNSSSFQRDWRADITIEKMKENKKMITSSIDLILEFHHAKDLFYLDIVYDTKLFDKKSIDYFFESYYTFIKRVFSTKMHNT